MQQLSYFKFLSHTKKLKSTTHCQVLFRILVAELENEYRELTPARSHFWFWKALKPYFACFSG